MNVTMINRKYTIENCQQYVGQIIWFLEILKVYYKETKECVKVYATCRCTRCGKIIERPITNILIGHSKSCGCLRKEQGLQRLPLAQQAFRDKIFHYNKWEYIDPNTVRVYFYNGDSFITDACSWVWLRRFVWVQLATNKYDPRSRRSAATTIHGARFAYHSLLLPIPPGNEYVRDHINQNALDNRYENLRVIRPRENTLNTKRFTDENYKLDTECPNGIYKNKKNNSYIVNMRVYDRRMTKSFHTLEEAIRQRRIWEQEYNQIIPLEVPRLFLPDGTLNLQNFRFDWYDDRYWMAWNHLGINLLPVPKQEYLRYMPTKDVMDFGYNGVYL